jgi:spermidine synthase
MDVQTATICADPRAASPAHSLVVPIFASTMFLSGFLLFLVEPMAARMVLPILGGAPMVWNACVVFFQAVMLAGYGYAYVASRSLPLRRQVSVYALVLAAPIVTLPFVIEPGSVPPPAGNPIAWLMMMLALTIGLPFFALSTSASVFQHWLSRTDHPAARDPYFLYSASNHGCLLALAAYPIAIEPLLTLREQSQVWAIGYGALVLLAAACGATVRRFPAPDADGQLEIADSTPAIGARRRVRWIALAFVPSSLMLGVTSYMSSDIAAFPLMWILPLALYLFTFATAFGRHATRAAAIARRAMPLLVVPLTLFMIAGVRAPLTAIVTLHLAAFTAIALGCHAQLAADRPDASRLTEFYVWVSVGGMLGGLFNTLLAPVVFNTIVEYPLVMVIGCLLLRATPRARAEQLHRRLVSIGAPVLVAALTAAALVLAASRSLSLSIQLTLLAAPALIAFAGRRDSRRFGASIAAMVLASLVMGNRDGRILDQTRTFFGVYRVNEDATGRYHGLVHGTTLHGMQALAADRRTEALTYYHASGPFGQAWRALPAATSGHEIGVIGLGVGTLATYATSGQRWTFFEIDPAIEKIARTPEYFSFMAACGSRCRVVIGDARIALTRMRTSDTFDVLVLDAFSSDAIPVHLVTREALSLYLSRLAPGGALVMHVSNRHLRLAPVVARLAEAESLVGMHQIELPTPDMPEGKSGSHWIVMARSRADLGSIVTDARWSPLVTSGSTPLWTDDFSNILSVLSLR